MNFLNSLKNINFTPKLFDMTYEKSEILNLYETEKNKTEVAKAYCLKKNIPYTDSIRKRISDVINSSEGNEENISVSETKGYEKTSLMPSAWDAGLNKFLTIDEYCDKYGLDKTTVKSSKLISHVQGHMTYNIVFFTPEEESVMNIENHLEAIVKAHIKPVYVPTTKASPFDTDIITTVTFTDTHVGMEPNADNNSLYGGKWDYKELLDRGRELVDATLSESIRNSSSILYIRDLGDLADGYNAETVRGGHELPQNMSNTEVFDTALRFKLEMLNGFLQSGQYKKIICHCSSNSNHGGDFDYFINSAFKQIAESWSDKVKVHNHRKFLFHYAVGDHCFIGSHGKDMDTLKFGFKPFLDSKGMEKIDGYIKANGLYKKYKYFHFVKGDSHQFLLDFSTSQDFDYLNYPAFSPSSKWVQNNFKKGISGFVIETFHPEKEEITFSYKKFDWKN